MPLGTTSAKTCEPLPKKREVSTTKIHHKKHLRFKVYILMQRRNDLKGSPDNPDAVLVALGLLLLLNAGDDAPRGTASTDHVLHIYSSLHNERGDE